MPNPIFMQRAVLLGIWVPLGLATLLFGLIMFLGKFFPPAADPLIVVGWLYFAVFISGAHIMSGSALVGLVVSWKRLVPARLMVMFSSAGALLVGLPLLVDWYRVGWTA